MATQRAARSRYPNGRYPAYYACIREAILGLGDAPVTVREALVVQRLLDAGVRSNAVRAEVEF